MEILRQHEGEGAIPLLEISAGRLQFQGAANFGFQFRGVNRLVDDAGETRLLGAGLLGCGGA